MINMITDRVQYRIAGLETEEATLWCGTVEQGLILQVNYLYL